MQAPKNNSKPRVLCDPGLHLSRLVQVVDLGNQRFQGKDPSRKIYFGFETLEATHVFDEKKGPEPFMLQIEFAFYMTSSGDKKTKLRQFVESWFNKAFPSDEEASAFDFSKLLGRLAGLMIAHQPKKDGNMKSVIVGICPPDKEKSKLEWPERNPQICYEIEQRESGGFSKLPPFLQTRIRESDDFKEQPQNEFSQESSYDTAEPDDDSIPF